MDSTISFPSAAATLNTSAPRVRRALSRLGASANEHRRLTVDQVHLLLNELGFAPAHNRLSREEMFILSALSFRPLGLRSARAVSRAAGVSPTTASRLLFSLERDGYVKQTTQLIADGRARQISVWEVDHTSPQWIAIREDVRKTILPIPSKSSDKTSNRVPHRLDHLFWNVDRKSLDVNEDGAFIAHRLLTSPDTQGLAWLAEGHVSSRDLRRAAKARGVTPRQRAFALNLAREL